MDDEAGALGVMSPMRGGCDEPLHVGRFDEICRRPGNQIDGDRDICPIRRESPARFPHQ